MTRSGAKWPISNMAECLKIIQFYEILIQVLLQQWNKVFRGFWGCWFQICPSQNCKITRNGWNGQFSMWLWNDSLKISNSNAEISGKTGFTDTNFHIYFIMLHSISNSYWSAFFLLDNIPPFPRPLSYLILNEWVAKQQVKQTVVLVYCFKALNSHNSMNQTVSILNFISLYFLI